MVARSAYEQLGNSPLLLLGTVLGMALVYLVPPAAFLFGLIARDPLVGAVGATGWAIMAALTRPTGRLYRRPGWESLLLPLAALIFTLATVDSAWRTWRGRRGGWKGRVYGGTKGEDG